jgi:type IV fimbrial biogenesis protein FimT
MNRPCSAAYRLAPPRRRRVSSRACGFTLVELMVTVAVAGTFIALGVPSFLRAMARHTILAQAGELQDAVRIGRNEAMKRAGPVVLCRTDPANTSHCAGSGGSWQTWLLFDDVARSGAFAGGDSILRQHLDVAGSLSITSDAPSIRFESTGIAHADTGSVIFQLAPAGSSADTQGADRALRRQVCVNPRGDVSVIDGGATCP